MIVAIGKYQGKTVENLVINEPGYIKWVIENRNAEGQLLQIKNEAERLINYFDQKPFAIECCGCREMKTTYVSLYRGSDDVFWWCDNCDPYMNGASEGKLTKARKYRDLLRHIALTCDNSKSSYKELVRRVARLKGLPKRVGHQQLKEFFEI